MTDEHGDPDREQSEQSGQMTGGSAGDDGDQIDPFGNTAAGPGAIPDDGTDPAPPLDDDEEMSPATLA